MSQNSQGNPIPPSTKPGWMYDYYTGFCMGPASYEQAEKYKAFDPHPMPWNPDGYSPTKVVIRKGPRKGHLLLRT